MTDNYKIMKNILKLMQSLSANNDFVTELFST